MLLYWCERQRYRFIIGICVLWYFSSNCLGCDHRHNLQIVQILEMASPSTNPCWWEGAIVAWQSAKFTDSRARLYRAVTTTCTELQTNLWLVFGCATCTMPEINLCAFKKFQQCYFIVVQLSDGYSHLHGECWYVNISKCSINSSTCWLILSHSPLNKSLVKHIKGIAGLSKILGSKPKYWGKRW